MGSLRLQVAGPSRFRSPLLRLANSRLEVIFSRVKNRSWNGRRNEKCPGAFEQAMWSTTLGCRRTTDLATRPNIRLVSKELLAMKGCRVATARPELARGTGDLAGRSGGCADRGRGAARPPSAGFHRQPAARRGGCPGRGTARRQGCLGASSVAGKLASPPRFSWNPLRRPAAPTLTFWRASRQPGHARFSPPGSPERARGQYRTRQPGGLRGAAAVSRSRRSALPVSHILDAGHWSPRSR